MLKINRLRVTYRSFTQNSKQSFHLPFFCAQEPSKSSNITSVLSTEAAYHIKPG